MRDLTFEKHDTTFLNIFSTSQDVINVKSEQWRQTMSEV